MTFEMFMKPHQSMYLVNPVDHAPIGNSYSRNIPMIKASSKVPYFAFHQSEPPSLDNAHITESKMEDLLLSHKPPSININRIIIV